MKENIVITELTSIDLAAYKAFLTQGLTSDEEHFRITPTDEEHAGFPTTGSADSFTLGAFIDGTLAGVASFEREGKNREKLRHKGLLFRMYVSPAHRGHGIARRLIEEVITRARHLPDIEQINLTVIAANSTAKHLYTKLGFKTYGTERNAIKWKDRYFDEDLMVLLLPAGHSS